MTTARRRPTATRRSRLRRAAPLGVACAVLALAACSAPPWQTADAAHQAATSTSTSASAAPTEAASAPAAASTAATASPAATSTAPAVANDLATGSAEHELPAGAMTLTAKYWSERDLRDWTAQSVKPLTIGLSATGGDTLHLDSVVVSVEALTADGWVAVPADAVTPPTLGGASPDIAAPSSAGLTVLVAGVDKDASALRFTIVYGVSSGSGSAQVDAVGNDSLVVTLAGGDYAAES